MKNISNFFTQILLPILCFSSCGGSRSETFIFNNSPTDKLIVELFSSKLGDILLKNDTICIIDGPIIKLEKFCMNRVCANQYQGIDTIKLVNEEKRNGCLYNRNESDLDYIFKRNLVEILRLDLKNKEVHLRIHVLPNNKLTIGYIGNIFSDMVPSVDWDSVKIIKKNEPIIINKENITSIITRENRTSSCGANENFFIIDENKNEN